MKRFAFLCHAALTVWLLFGLVVLAQAQVAAPPASPASNPRLLGRPATPTFTVKRDVPALPSTVPALGKDVVAVTHTLPDGTRCVFVRYGTNIAASCDFKHAD